MNVIDSLVVLLGLDSSGFEKGQKQAQEGLKKTGDEAEKQRKRHESESKKSAEAFNTVRDSIMGITAAIVTAVAGGEFLSFLTKNDTAITNLSRNVGAANVEVSALEGVFRRMGSSTGDAEAFLRTVNKIQEEIKLTGTSGALLPFVQAGLDVAKFRNAGPQQAMDLLADASAKMNPRDAQFRLQAAGMSESQINIILRGRDAVDAMFESQKKLNIVTDADGQKARERQTAWADLGEAFEGTARQIANFLTPALVGVAHALTNFIVWVRDNVPGAVLILGTLGSTLLLLKGFSIASMASAFTGNIAMMATAVGGLLGKLGLLGLAGTAGYAVGSGLNSLFGLDDIISNWFTGPDPSMAGGYVPGTQKGLGRGGGGSGTLGSRNNNPGNLRFAGQTGASHGAGGFASFGSITEGLAALEAQLTLDGNRGMTLAQMIAKYAPASDGNNVGAYIADVSKRTGLGANSRINTSDPVLMQSLVSAMAAHEGNPVDLGRISAGMNLAQSRGQGVGAPTVNVAQVTIKTSSSTMTGTGADLGKGLQNHLYSLQANAGVN